MSTAAITPPVTGGGPPPYFKAYPKTSTAYDELVNAQGEMRPQWGPVLNELNELGGPEVSRRWENARRFIRENGVTYNVYGDPNGIDRPWELDPVPFLITREEVEKLSEGLRQRARLLDMVVRDLYGPQKLLSQGLLPPALVFGHPAFLRPCHGMTVPGETMLHLYAADVARSPDGQWWVLSDRTQAPSGAGYALENRQVLSRVMPDVFQSCDVQRLAPFFQKLQDTLAGLASRRADNPRIVLLTPGPYNETYFEHSYLARALGYTLVEGGDLTVRDNHVFLKTLSGLQPVDVIFRRLDEDFCDPLELRRDSSLGVAGLLQAAKAGNVVIANALGSGLVETPALKAFLNPLCRHMLGEKLLIPSVATWWCGHRREKDYVLDHLDSLVVRPTFGADRNATLTEPELTRAQKADLAARVRFRPHDFTGHERVALSTAPGLSESGLEPRGMVLRLFLVSNGGDYFMMPGGLTRIRATRPIPNAAAPASAPVSMQRGDGSKDTWVMNKGAGEDKMAPRPALQSLELKRSGNELASRVADNLFWLGRYAERADASARLFRSVLVRLTDESTKHTPAEMRGFLLVPERLGILRFSPAVATNGASAALSAEALEQELFHSIFHNERAGGLSDTINRMHRVGSGLRDRLSTDQWRILGLLDSSMASPENVPDLQISEVVQFLTTLIIRLAAFSGLVMENMTRGQGWRFLDLGRRLERAVGLLRLLRLVMTSQQAEQQFTLEGLLDLADSAMTYRARYFVGAQTPAVLDLILCDETNPRSVAFQINAALEHIDKLPRDQGAAFPTREKKALISALNRLRLSDIGALVEENSDGSRTRLDALLASLMSDLPECSDQLTLDYFSHTSANTNVTVTWPAAKTGETPA